MDKSLILFMITRLLYTVVQSCRSFTVSCFVNPRHFFINIQQIRLLHSRIYPCASTADWCNFTENMNVTI